MSIIETVMNIPEADHALGLHFCTKDILMQNLSEHAHVFACCEACLFCTFDGYQDTVFSYFFDDKVHLLPLAYDFREFLRLVLACGSASGAATIAKRIACDPDNEVSFHIPDSNHDLKWIADRISLSPIRNPVSYLQTIMQVIDISRILLL